jgi:hypothetical protein
LFFPGRVYLTPRISFAAPVMLEELQRESRGNRILPAIITRGKALLTDHMAWVRGIDED